MQTHRAQHALQDLASQRSTEQAWPGGQAAQAARVAEQITVTQAQSAGHAGRDARARDSARSARGAADSRSADSTSAAQVPASSVSVTAESTQAQAPTAAHAAPHAIQYTQPKQQQSPSQIKRPLRPHPPPARPQAERLLDRAQPADDARHLALEPSLMRAPQSSREHALSAAPARSVERAPQQAVEVHQAYSGRRYTGG